MQVGRFGNKLFKQKYDFWNNKKVIITGCTGFKGSWLTIILKRYGASIIGIALPPKKKNDIFNKAQLKKKIKFFNCDINNSKRINKIILLTKPDIVFHLAAQTLVLKSYKKTQETYLTNIIGSSNIIEACLNLKKKNTLVITTTDKVYNNKNNFRKFVETDELSGNDPYSASKASLEVLCKYYISLTKIHNFFSMSIARAGNVIGGGDWSENRLFPDIFRAINNKKKIILRNPNSTRPWQHVLDSLYGYLSLAEMTFKYKKYCTAYNFGPKKNVSTSVLSIVNKIKESFADLKIKIKKNKHYESKTLELNSNKAKRDLFFNPLWNLEHSITKTINWYFNFKKNETAASLCLNDIECYEKDFNKKNNKF